MTTGKNYSKEVEYFISYAVMTEGANPFGHGLAIKTKGIIDITSGLLPLSLIELRNH